MSELINFCFNGGNKAFTGITRFGAIWTNSREEHSLPFNKTSLKVAISYLQNHSYFTFTQTFLWKTYFCVTMKGSSFYK